MWNSAFWVGVSIMIALVGCSNDASRPIFESPDASLDMDGDLDSHSDVDIPNDSGPSSDVGFDADVAADAADRCEKIEGLTQLITGAMLGSSDTTGFAGLVTPSVGLPGEDLLWIETGSNPAAGVATVALPLSGAACHDGSAPCITLFLDTNEPEPSGVFAATGTLDIKLVSLPHYLDATLDLEFVEIRSVPEDQTFELVPDGRCFRASNLAFQMVPPVPGWTCAFGQYNDGFSCDCKCGVLDPDCVAGRPTGDGCAFGQVCSDDGTQCLGTPTNWNCDAQAYDGGPGNGCDCNCGVYDPDCDLVGETLNGCGEGDVCHALGGNKTNGAGVCVAPGWTCPALLYDSTRRDGDGQCDCGCGVVDPDCADATLASCDRCEGTGNCVNASCAQDIDPTNNAICL